MSTCQAANRLHVLHVTSFHMPALQFGTPVWFSHEIATGLAARGYQVNVGTASCAGDGRGEYRRHDKGSRRSDRVVLPMESVTFRSHVARDARRRQTLFHASCRSACDGRLANAGQARLHGPQRSEGAVCDFPAGRPEPVFVSSGATETVVLSSTCSSVALRTALQPCTPRRRSRSQYSADCSRRQQSG